MEVRGDNLHVFAEALEFCFASYLMTAVFAPTHRQTFLWLLVGLSVATARVAGAQALIAGAGNEALAVPPQPEEEAASPA